MRVVVIKILNMIGPILLSVLSILSSFLILQPIALWLDPSFNLLASRGISKVAFISLIIFQIILFLSLLSKKFFQQFLQTNFYFFINKNWLKDFFKYFFLFAFLHFLVVIFFFSIESFPYNSEWGTFNFNLILNILWGFVGAFFLAWTEELIFRGTLFPYFNQFLGTFSSIILTSTFFMLVHSITAPWELVTTHWELGLGLFLLGVLLNAAFAITGKLYVGMGIHSGLVFVKVILRRMPFFPSSFDLRISHVAHFLFLALIIFLMIKNKEKIFKK